MSDEVDRAQIEVDRTLREALRSRKASGPVATGECLHCGEPLTPPLRWCGPGCRDEWEGLTRRRR